MDRIKVNTINPDAEEKLAGQDRESRLQGARAADTARDKDLDALLTPSTPQSSPSAPPPASGVATSSSAPSTPKPSAVPAPESAAKPSVSASGSPAKLGGAR